MMYKDLMRTIDKMVAVQHISEERKNILQPLIDFVQHKASNSEEINLNFICTHNARRSHLAQVWAQVASAYHRIPNVHCYSGGTEETALFPNSFRSFCPTIQDMPPTRVIFVNIYQTNIR